MAVWDSLRRIARRSPWITESAAAVLWLLCGCLLLPLLIFYSGAAALGRYENASLGRLYSSIFDGLAADSVASWLVVLGPYALYLLFRLVAAWWRASARLAA